MNIELSKRLASCRLRTGETMEQVAEACGISHVALSRYESGQRVPKTEILSRLADHYGETVDSLLGKEQVNTSANDKDEAWAIRERLRRDPDYRVLFDAADKATPEHLRAAAAMLKALEPTDD